MRTLLAVSLALLLATGSVAAAQDDGLDQTLDPDQPTGTGQVVASQGHVDIGPVLRDGQWRIMIHDDSEIPSVWRSPTDMVLQVGDDAVLPVPEDPAYAFLGADPGTEVYVIPQTQRSGVVWVGWNTQDPNVMGTASLGVTLTYHGVQGPGDLVVFLQSGTLGAPDVLWDSKIQGSQELFVENNTHTHANWVFTEPGVYLVDFEISAQAIDGTSRSDRGALRFAVGSGTDPREAFDAVFTPAEPDPAGEPGADRPGGAAADLEETAGFWQSYGWFVLVGLVVVLVLALLATVVRGRRIRAAVDRQTRGGNP